MKKTREAQLQQALADMDRAIQELRALNESVERATERIRAMNSNLHPPFASMLPHLS